MFGFTLPTMPMLPGFNLPSLPKLPDINIFSPIKGVIDGVGKTIGKIAGSVEDKVGDLLYKGQDFFARGMEKGTSSLRKGAFGAMSEWTLPALGIVAIISIIGVVVVLRI